MLGSVIWLRHGASRDTEVFMPRTLWERGFQGRYFLAEGCIYQFLQSRSYYHKNPHNPFTALLIVVNNVLKIIAKKKKKTIANPGTRSCVLLLLLEIVFCRFFFLNSVRTGNSCGESEQGPRVLHCMISRHLGSNPSGYGSVIF